MQSIRGFQHLLTTNELDRLDELLASEFFKLLWSESVVIQELIISSSDLKQQTFSPFFWILPQNACPKFHISDLVLTRGARIFQPTFLPPYKNWDFLHG